MAETGERSAKKNEKEKNRQKIEQKKEGVGSGEL